MREKLADIIRYFNDIINTNLSLLSDDFSFKLLIILMGIAFVYGIIHSAGPGHGKSLVLSYFLKEKNRYRKSLFLAAIISIIHTGSAILLSFLFAFVITGVKGFFKIKLQKYFMIASGVMIVIVGIIFLIFKLLHKENIIEETENVSNNRSLLAVGFSAGIVPCPVSMMIMVFAFTKKIPLVGFLIVISISLGMFVLLSSVGSITILMRKGLFDATNERWKSIISSTLEYLSIVMILFIGIFIIASHFI